jgi:hypothetical protein
MLEFRLLCEYVGCYVSYLQADTLPGKDIVAELPEVQPHGCFLRFQCPKYDMVLSLDMQHDVSTFSEFLYAMVRDGCCSV